MKDIIIAIGLLILSPSLFAQRVPQVFQVLPEGVYQGENCQVLVGTGFTGLGVIVSINHLSRTGTLVQTSFSFYDDSPWSRVLQDNSQPGMIDLTVKRNTGLIQRLLIEDAQVLIQDMKGSRIRSEAFCQL